MSDRLLLQMERIRKTFPGVLALDNLSFALAEGEVHGLLGENGAGKSTLINVLGGIYKPDAGEIRIAGQKADIHNVASAQNHGIGIIHQELVLVPHMTISENVFLGRELKNKLGQVDKQKMNQETLEILKLVGLELNPRLLVKRLSVAQQQMVEIAKALSLKARILVMDEPTSSLTQSEVATLFETIRRLKGQGTGIIFISHKMNELFAITDRITVIRDGSYVGTKETDKTNIDELVQMMVGRELTSYYTRNNHKRGEVVLAAENLASKRYFHDINFQVRRGEITGFAGLVGSGRSELFKAILGIEPLEHGKIYLNGIEEGRLTPRKAQERGLVMVPEDRKKEGLVLIHSVGFNLTLSVLDQFIKGIFVNKKARRAIEKKYIDQLNIKTPSYQQKAGNLSGGNQQKIVIGRWLAASPDILVLDEPTRGVDVGAKAEIYKIIDELAGSGLAVVMISSELPELINMCDRILVMSQGRITGELTKEEFSQEKIMQYATGGLKG